MKKLSLLLSFYFLSIAALFFYSYTQVDLSLTLSKASLYQTVEKGFQYIGYFQRPLSTNLYIIIIALLTTGYIWLLFVARKGRLSVAMFWKITLLCTIILTFSYNAFSYDLFNNIFDAKIITHYHQNPFIKTALDFPHDPMLSFMHWVQRPYPYGPIMLVFTVPLSYIGLQYFLPTFFLFKIVNGVLFLGIIYFLRKIILIVHKKEDTFTLVLFALNPLVLIEALVSAHNDIAMLFLALWGIYLLLKKKWLLAGVLILLSALTKQVSVFLFAPVFVYMISEIFFKKHFLSLQKFLWFCVFAMTAGLFYVLTQREFQPWYLLWILPFLVLVQQSKLLISFIIGISVGALLRYVPFLYLGNWDGIAIPIRFWVVVITPVVFVGFTLVQIGLARLYRK